MHNLKVLLETLGYGFGALFVLAGLTGAPSAVALGLGLLALTLLASNAWGIRAHVPCTAANRGRTVSTLWLPNGVGRERGI